MSKMTMRNRCAVTLRGFRILKKYCPGLAQGKALYEFIHSTQPFFTVWFSARIIDALSAQQMESAIRYAVGIVLIHFVCSVLKGCVRRVCDEKEMQMWNWFGKIFSDKQMSLDFEDLENARIQRQRQEAEENLYMFGNGLAQLVWGTTALVKAGVCIFASLAMGVSLFTARSGMPVMDHPVWVLLVLLCVGIGGFSKEKATVKEDQVFTKWCQDTVWFNRTFMFFGQELYSNPERAKDVRIYRQDRMAEKALDQLIQADRQHHGDSLKMAFYPAAASVLIGLANAVGYLFVVLKAYFGAFGIGSIVQYAAVLQKLGDGLKEIMFILSDNQVYCQHLQKLFAYLDLPNHMYQGTLTVEKRDDNEYFVEFRNVSFQYPGSGQFALRHVNLRFQVGKKLAIVGMNGSGKTTFIKLLCRLYDPTEGEILLNGVDIRKYDYEEYLSLFSVVFQDFRLFSFGLGQNVAAGMNYDPSWARSCLMKAGFKDRLQKMPEGLDTCLYKDFEKNGVEISGGEAQKIALARALYKQAPFMVLDEPTAALDPMAEYEVYARMNEMVGGKTAIYISHRLASCRFCDMIAVFDQGQIVQQGTHEQLLAVETGKYYELWHAQAQYYV